METTPATENFIRIALKASNGKYVTTGNPRSVLRAKRDAIGSSEIFRMIELEGKLVALKASNGKYVSSPKDGQPLTAVTDTVGAAESFDVQDWGGNKVALYAYNWKFVSLDQSDFSLKATGDAVTGTDTFDLILLAEDGTPANKPDTAAPREKRSATPLSPGSSPGVYTVCFSGTGCTRDEGEVTRPESDKRIYSWKTGYIPVRIHKEISGDLKATSPSVTIRGVGENDWATPRYKSERLKFDGPLDADDTLLSYIESYSGGDQLSKTTELNGWSAPALALHAANLAAASGKQQYNFIGHSRGAVECIMTAWFLYAYGSNQVKNTPVNIFAIDPVPGTGEWYGILTQLPPNVVSYVGIYAWDMCVQPGDKPYAAVVPRPNGRMTGRNNHVNLKDSWWWPWNKWKYIADDAQLTDPLEPGNLPQPLHYELYACRGRHSTVSGNSTNNGGYNPDDVSNTVSPVPKLIYKMARAYLTNGGQSSAPEVQ